MDAIRISRKRKHSSSSRPHPLSGTLTRSKSHIFLHRNRSGHLHSDSRRRQLPYARSRRSRLHPMGRGSDTRKRLLEEDGESDNDDAMILIKDLRKKPKPKPKREGSTGDGEDIGRVLIKDLRLRRFYSPQSSVRGCSDLIQNVFLKENGVVDSDLKDQKIAELGFGKPSVEVENSGDGKEVSKVKEESDMNIDDVISTRIVATESPDSGLSNEVLNSDKGSTELSYKSCKSQENGQNSSEKVEDLIEKLALSTPPDVKICNNSVVDGDEGKPVEEICIGVEDMIFVGNAEKNAGEGFCPKDDDSQRNDSVLESKSALRPISQEKLFKTPGAVSYKRLFPFLMEIMGDDFGTKLGYCQKDEKGVNDGQEFQLPLSQEGSKCELKTDSCTVGDVIKLEASEGDATIAHVNDLSYGKESKLTSAHCLSQSPMRLHIKEVTRECLSVPYVNDTCLRESKAAPTADFHCVKDAGNALHIDDIKQDANHKSNLDHSKETSHGGCTSEQFGVLNEDSVLTTPPDAVICDNPEVNLSQLESMPQDVHHVKPVGLTISTPENAGESFCVKADKRKEVRKSKSVPRPSLNRKLFKTPGSVSYRRMLPFLKNLTKDDSVMSEICHQTLHQKDEVDMYAKKFELPLSSQGREASIDTQKRDSFPTHGTVKSNALVNNVLVDPANLLSLRNQPQLTSSQGLPESPMQLDAKVVHELLSAPSHSEHIEKVEIGSKDICLSDSKFDLCSEMVDSQCAKNVANAVHNDDFENVQNKISRQHNSESTPQAQNLLYISDVSSLAFEHCSSKEKGFTIDCDERKQFEGKEKRESVVRNPPEGQSLNQLDPNMLDAEKEASSHAIIRKDDAVVSNDVSVSNEEPRPPSEMIILEKSDMRRHGSDNAESVLTGMVNGPSMPSKGSNTKSTSCVRETRTGSESKTTLALKPCSRVKLLKHAGSFSYKRMLPFLLSNMKDNSCASVIDHNPKLHKCLDQTPLLPISASDLQVTPISGSDGCVLMDDCGGNSGTQQETGLHAHDLNNDSSSPISQIPGSQSSHDSCKVIQLQDEQVVLNGCCNLERSPDPSISVHKIDSTVNEIISMEEVITAIPVSSIYPEVKGNNSFLISSNEEKTPETQGLSQEKVLEQLRVSAVGFKKGILKRNPRGCRGLCTCLNCVSFRLHAERAFEFSRNQFLDAEEVALDLIKELSHLRNMLERTTDNVNGNPVIDVSQVEEACEKAFATEQLAKDRLSQMNDDLNIHCRITSLQRPRVKFTDNVEEKVIQPSR